jgi:integral membrane protein
MDIIKKLRIVGIAEGVSFILLMGIAMPLKYLYDMPLAVKYVGWIHGVLFMIYCFVAFMAMYAERLNFKWTVITLIAALFPFGPFLIDGKLRKF